MSTPVTYVGSIYNVPAYQDTGYAQGTGNLSSYLIALATGSLTLSGGTFTLTADANFGANFGLVSLYYKSRSAIVATSGQIRLGNTDSIVWRNAGNTGNLSVSVNASDQFAFNGSMVVDTDVFFVDGTNNRVGIGTLTPDAPLKILKNGAASRISSINFQNSGFTRPGAIVITNQDAPGLDVGSNVAFYQNTNGSGTDVQHGALVFSQDSVGADQTEAKFELFLRSGDSSVQVLRAMGINAPGYAYFLFGPDTVTPASNIHVISDSGDVDSGIRIQRVSATTGRYNMLIASDGAFYLREVDTSGRGIYLQKTTGVVGVSTQSPIATIGGLDVSSGGLCLVIGADSAATTRTNATTKLGRFGAAHYTNSEEPVGIAVASIDSSANLISYGGGSGLVNAATELRFYTATTQTTTTGTQRLAIDTNGNVIVGSAAIATTATDGFLYVTACAGTPTGAPTAVTGRAPVVVDSTNNKMYFYSNGAWRDVGP